MDGSSKFVRGDAIAGIIIIVINIVGGIVIGIVQLGLNAGDAFQRFALLTVGGGLVNQIPALLISTATGIVVTRAASNPTWAVTSPHRCWHSRGHVHRGRASAVSGDGARSSQGAIPDPGIGSGLPGFQSREVGARGGAGGGSA